VREGATERKWREERERERKKEKEKEKGKKKRKRDREKRERKKKRSRRRPRSDEHSHWSGMTCGTRENRETGRRLYSDVGIGFLGVLGDRAGDDFGWIELNDEKRFENIFSA
jgi:hypothetical protein